MITQQEINNWVESGADFDSGVKLYYQLPNPDPKVLRSLTRGKNAYNKSLLLKELRVFCATYTPKSTAKTKKTPTKTPPKPQQPVTDAIIAKEHKETQLKTASFKKSTYSIKYAELPGELRPRFIELRDLFYQKSDLKFLLNDVPPKDEKTALALQLQIEELDDKRLIILKEINHWQTYKTMLPKEADKFNDLSNKELWRLKKNLDSKITKMEQRINANYELLESAKTKTEVIKLERKINNSEKKLHKHILNRNRIKELI